MNPRKPKKPMGRPKGNPRAAAEIAADAKRTGRPALAGDENVSKVITMRLTPAEFKQFKKDAEKRGMWQAAFARHCLSIAKGINYGNDIQDTKNRVGGFLAGSASHTTVRAFYGIRRFPIRCVTGHEGRSS